MRRCLLLAACLTMSLGAVDASVPTEGGLEFRVVLAEYPDHDFPSTRAGAPDCAWMEDGPGQYTWNPRVSHIGQACIDPLVSPPGEAPTKFLGLGPVRLDAHDVAQVTAADHGGPALIVTFTAEGAERNRRFTAEQAQAHLADVNTGRIAIVLHHEVRSAPIVVATSSTKSMISGRFTPEEIADLVAVLRSYSPR